MAEPDSRETAIAQGTLLLRPAELAPRIGLGKGRSGRQMVIARAKAGLLPCRRPSPKVFLFSWPEVMAALGRNGLKRGLRRTQSYV